MPLTAYDSASNPVDTQTITADQTWQPIGVAQPVGQVPRIVSFALHSTPSGNEVGVDDLSFDNPTTASATFTTAQSPTFRGAGAGWFGARTSTASDGHKIVSYGWDFNNDGQVDETGRVGSP